MIIKEKPVIGQVLNQVGSHVELKELAEQIQLAEDIKDILADYQRLTSKDIRYVWPKTGSRYKPLIDKYLVDKREQTFNETGINPPQEFTPEDWTDLKTAISVRLNRQLPGWLTLPEPGESAPPVEEITSGSYDDMLAFLGANPGAEVTINWEPNEDDPVYAQPLRLQTDGATAGILFGGRKQEASRGPVDLTRLSPEELAKYIDQIWEQMDQAVQRNEPTDAFDTELQRIDLEYNRRQDTEFLSSLSVEELRRLHAQNLAEFAMAAANGEPIDALKERISRISDVLTQKTIASVRSNVVSNTEEISGAVTKPEEVEKPRPPEFLSIPDIIQFIRGKIENGEDAIFQIPSQGLEAMIQSSIRLMPLPHGIKIDEIKDNEIIIMGKQARGFIKVRAKKSLVGKDVSVKFKLTDQQDGSIEFEQVTSDPSKIDFKVAKIDIEAQIREALNRPINEIIREQLENQLASNGGSYRIHNLHLSFTDKNNLQIEAFCSRR